MISIRIDGAEKVANDFAMMSKNIPIQTEIALDNMAMETEVIMKDKAPIASGELRGSISTDGSTPGIRIIGPKAEHGYYQENRNWLSQRTPPKEKILEWARVKGFTDTAWGGGESQMAFLIARKISLRGYQAQTFVKDTFYWLSGQIEQYAVVFLSAVVSGVGGAI
jgi:hypothetical protein